MKYAPSQHPEWQLAVTAGLVLTAAIAYAVAVKGPERGAFNRWRPILHTLPAGDDIYLLHNFPTPPTMAWILYPFARLPKPWGFVAWTGMEAIAAIAAMAALAKQAKIAFADNSATPALLAIALAAVPMTADITHGNVNLWIFALVAGGTAALLAGRWGLAGAAISLAAACKVTPALLVVYLIWKRHWNAAAAALIGTVVWLVLLPAAWLGFERNAQLLASWSRQTIAPYLLRGQVDTEQVNQSLPALLHRSLTQAIAIRGDDGQLDRSIGLVDLDNATMRLVAAVACGAVLLGLAVATAGPWDHSDRRRRLHEIGLAIVVMLLVSERSWKHHYAALFVPCLALASERRAAARRLRNGFQLSAATVALLATALGQAAASTDLVRVLGGGDGAKWAQAWGAYTLAAITLGMAHAAALRGPWSQAAPVTVGKSTIQPELELA